MGVLESSQKFAATQQKSQQEKATFKMLGNFLMCLSIPSQFGGSSGPGPRPCPLKQICNFLTYLQAACGIGLSIAQLRAQTAKAAWTSGEDKLQEAAGGSADAWGKAH